MEGVVTWFGYSTRYEYTFHPQTNGLCEHMIQVLGDMLRAWVIDFGARWD